MFFSDYNIIVPGVSQATLLFFYNKAMKKILGQLVALSNYLDDLGYYNMAEEIDSLLIKTAAYADSKERFWAKVDKTPTCWLWLGAKATNGYGICTIDGKNYSAHRLSWQWANEEEVPKGHVVCHECDQPLCVNPNHLFTHTQQGNVLDRVNKGRSARGKNNGRTRLNQKDVKKIKALRSRGMTESAIAKMFGVGRSTISNILHNRTWNWL